MEQKAGAGLGQAGRRAPQPGSPTGPGAPNRLPPQQGAESHPDHVGDGRMGQGDTGHRKSRGSELREAEGPGDQRPPIPANTLD